MLWQTNGSSEAPEQEWTVQVLLQGEYFWLELHILYTFPLAVAVLLAVIIILITGALAVGVFLNYKRTGSFIPSMPKLPRYLCSQHPHVSTRERRWNVEWTSTCGVLSFSSLSSLVKSADAGNGVMFRSGDNVDLGPSQFGVSFIDTAMQMVSLGLLAVNAFVPSAVLHP